MPAVVDDPASPTIYRVSGQAPFPDPGAPLPVTIVPRRVTLRDRQTVATILPIVSAQHQVPASLITYLCGQINREIEGGDTYPMMEPFTPAGFAAHWFQNFGAVMLLGDYASADRIPDSHDWARDCLGSFYIKPNYPGRSSHVCNGGLLVTDASRNRGVGRLMGESYIDWAPRLGYTYSVFNLVYETNVASCRIWDALGFKRIGRVKGCGNLRSHPDRLIDAIIYGRDLPPPRAPGDGGADGDADGTGGGGVGGMLFVSEERFDKIRYYLKFGRYPDGADRAEKSRLRSAATHYKLLDDGDTLMLKDKLVVSDPARQYDIARETHSMHHGGINKTTAIIAEKYHWSRIKETVSDVIRLCKECKELAKAPPGAGSNGGGGATGTATTAMQPGQAATRAAASKPTTPLAGAKRSRSPSPDKNTAGSSSLAGTLSSPPRSAPESASHHIQSLAASITTSTTTVDNDRVLGLRMHHTNSTLLSGTLPSSPSTVNPLLHHGGGGGSAVVVGHHHHHHDGVPGPYANPSDISVVRPSQTTLHDGVGGVGGGGGAVAFLHTPHHHHHHHDDDNDDTNGHAAPHDVYQPIDPQIMNHPHHTFDGYHPHADFQALLHATEDDGGAAESERRAAVDRDLEMLIEHGADDEEEEDVEEVGEENDGNKQGKDHGDIGAGVLGKMQRPSGGDGAEHGNDGADEGGAAAVVGDEQADADMDDLDDSILQDTRGWT
ncbi:histone acetyltransferase Spt10 [Cordyceps javanica]|uniref:Histone acetyltransferase Spt10 n=1 Tax=Cordyceps javanica TaxID=43265 RepID=A0A545W627_9HYPO|nr:histone acetyltransferase Spt10 [Cordyceps javanica]TQW09434.1 histone acetyltransferase Spt10 [Cordyceps javanica]